jgi:hypothetical protein
MDEVPVSHAAVGGRVLAHRRNDHTVGQLKDANPNRCKQSAHANSLKRAECLRFLSIKLGFSGGKKLIETTNRPRKLKIFWMSTREPRPKGTKGGASGTPALQEHRFEADPVVTVREKLVACEVLSQLQRVMDNPRSLLAGECVPLRAGDRVRV